MLTRGRPQLAAACLFTATAAMYFAKLPILIFVMRTFGIHKWLRYTGYFLIVITALCFFAAAMWTGAHCSPGLHIVDEIFLMACVKSTYETTVSRNSLSLVVDLVIFALPLPFVAGLKLSRRKKIGVSLVFLTGSFGIVAAVVSLYYQTGQASKSSSSITLAMLTTYAVLFPGSMLPKLTYVACQHYRVFHIPHRQLRTRPATVLVALLWENGLRCPARSRGISGCINIQKDARRFRLAS